MKFTIFAALVLISVNASAQEYKWPRIESTCCQQPSYNNTADRDDARESRRQQQERAENNRMENQRRQDEQQRYNQQQNDRNARQRINTY